MRLSFADGSSSLLRLADEPELQCFPVSGSGTEAKLEILQIYPGAESGDVYLSEVEFGSQAAPRFVSFEQLIQEKADPNSRAQSPAAISGPKREGGGWPWPWTVLAAVVVVDGAGILGWWRRPWRARM